MDQFEWNRALAQLMWHVELGAVDALGAEPVDRYALPKAAPALAAPPVAPPVGQTDAALRMAGAPAASAPPVSAPPPVKMTEADVTRALAHEAKDLEALRRTMAEYDGCELKKGARNLVFSDGNSAADVMVIGEAPGKDEDHAGRPFIGPAGQLLDKMFAAIGRTREATVAKEAMYLTNVMPWRLPQNRDPLEDEIDMMVPFVRRHIALVRPKVIVLMGNIACKALLGQKGITQLRGTWTDVEAIPALPMLHPAYLLRRPDAKADTWRDLKAVMAKLKEVS